MEERNVHDLNCALRCRQKQHVVSVWRRVLVVERIFRQRVYNLLPNMVAQHDGFQLRRATRSWREWSRHSRKLRLNLQRYSHACSRRLAYRAFVGLIQHFEQALDSNRIAARGIRIMSHCCDKLVMARIVWRWMMVVRAGREEALLKDRVVSDVKHSESSNFALTCGTALRCWALHSRGSRGHRKRLHMVLKIARRTGLQRTFLRFVNVIKCEKRHAHIILSCRKMRAGKLTATGFSCVRKFTANGRFLGLLLARKKRLLKSRLLLCWQQENCSQC